MSSSAELLVRPMRQSDLDFADELRASAGWNQTRRDWQRILELSPEGCFIAELSGAPAGTVTTIEFGKEIAWIGMLLVRPEDRGKGIGTALFNQALNHLKAAGVRSIMLDATPDGQPLYEKFGFTTEWTLHRWQTSACPPCPALAESVRPLTSADWAEVGPLDSRVFGANRITLLKALANEAAQTVVSSAGGKIVGYGMRREGARARYLGPLIATRADAGVALAQTLLAEASGRAVFWDIPDANSEAVALAQQLGFTRQRSLVRMRQGPVATRPEPNLYFGIADPALG